MHNILITICARGGSKGVKGKNIRPLLGRPLICYTIEHGLQWPRGKHVVVSTDSEQIADVAKEAGAEVPFIRPRELATDTMGKIDVIRHAVDECEKVYEEKYDIVVDLDATAPVRTVADIENCYQMFIANRPKTLFSVVPAHKNPYFNMVETSDGERVRLVRQTGDDVTRRQDAPCVYDMNASIYFYDREYIADTNNTTPISDDSCIYVMDDSAGVDIDREIDFKFVEFLVGEQLVQL